MQVYSAAKVDWWQISLYLGPAQCEIKQCFCPQWHPLVFMPVYPYQDLSEWSFLKESHKYYLKNTQDNILQVSTVVLWK